MLLFWCLAWERWAEGPAVGGCVVRVVFCAGNSSVCPVAEAKLTGIGWCRYFEAKKRIRVKRLLVTERNCTGALHSRNRKLLMRSSEGIGGKLDLESKFPCTMNSCLKSLLLSNSPKGNVWVFALVDPLCCVRQTGFLLLSPCNCVIDVLFLVEELAEGVPAFAHLLFLSFV